MSCVVQLRPADPTDEAFLWQMLFCAAHVNEQPGRGIIDVKADSDLARYVTGWGRSGDVGVIAVDGGSSLPVGAAWCRLFVAGDKAYGAVDDYTPELAIAVDPEFIGWGIGTLLMSGLVNECRGVFDEIALNVRASNPAVRLYRRLGFTVVGEVVNRVGSISYDMRMKLQS